MQILLRLVQKSILNNATRYNFYRVLYWCYYRYMIFVLVLHGTMSMQLYVHATLCSCNDMFM